MPFLSSPIDAKRKWSNSDPRRDTEAELISTTKARRLYRAHGIESGAFSLTGANHIARCRVALRLGKYLDHPRSSTGAMGDVPCTELVLKREIALRTTRAKKSNQIAHTRRQAAAGRHSVVVVVVVAPQLDQRPDQRRWVNMKSLVAIDLATYRPFELAEAEASGALVGMHAIERFLGDRAST
jgi:hypothetical protein